MAQFRKIQCEIVKPNVKLHNPKIQAKKWYAEILKNSQGGEAMSDFKVSFHEDDSFNLEHDNRVRVSKNVDADRIKDNISYDGNISIKEFYDMTFQKSYVWILKNQSIQVISGTVALLARVVALQ